MGSPGPAELLNLQQQEALQRLLADITPDQLLWLRGYLAGFSAGRVAYAVLPPAVAGPELQVAVASGEQPSETVVLFGSQTGNAEKLARELAARLSQESVPVRVEAMNSYKTARLKRESSLLVVVSTHGEGEPPDNARPFHEFLFSKKAPQLPQLHYSVLGLGDSSYEFFCKTGQDFDARLAELGGTPLYHRADCDVDYEEAAAAWIEGVAGALQQTRQPHVQLAAARPAPVSAYSKQNPYPARLIENLRLTGRGSTKDVRHIELSLEGSGLRYEPGDALGVVASNWPERVAQLIETLGLDPAAAVPGSSGAAATLEHALLHDYEITTITRPFLERYAAAADSASLKKLLAPEQRAAFRDYIHGREIIDVVREWPVAGIHAGQFLGLLRKLPHRLYSIASSYQATPDEVHLTVAVVRYESHGLKRQGVASTFLADRVADDGTVPVFVSSNPNFRLPADPDTAVVMIGPGTGVAPFRAFLAEREAAGAAGRNWLFFGDRNFLTDFLYQTEWLDYRAKGLLNRIDVAFSRDTDRKVYVQHKIRDRSRELFDWLEEGAHLYVCGDGQQMAVDVHDALIESVQAAGGFGRERAEDYVAGLQAAGRYQRDVY